ncbi:MAG TPA: hypothetical protein VM123_21660 [archaeon]|nr:hypothetical protein [archaeon]
MHIITPAEIKSIAWEGELVSPSTTYTYSLKAPERPVATLGQPEIWTVSEALENEVGRKWTPPIRDADFWLLRLACTLRKPRGLAAITEACHTLYLRPQNSSADSSTTYAFSLYPDRLSAEDQAEFDISLDPELKFAGFEAKLGHVGAKITYRKVFPVIQGYGAGESSPNWLFKPHAAYPLDGSQFVYAVVAAGTGSGGIRAYVDLRVELQKELLTVRFGLPEEANANIKFTIP